MDKLILAFGAIAAALIAGCFTFMALINLKEQKTSEFRQDWINALRKEISELVSSVYSLEFYYQYGAKNSDPDFIKWIRETNQVYNQASSSILLRINQQEKEEPLKSINEKFLTKLTAVLQAVSSQDYCAAAVNCNAIIEESKPLLKEEWKRVKAGERPFRISKWIAGLVFAVGIIFSIFVGLKIFTYEPDKDKDKTTFNKEPLYSPVAPVTQNCSLTIPSWVPIKANPYSTD